LLEGQEELSAVNTDELEHALFEAEQRVLKIQTKLHRWARDDPRRRFDDLFNLVADPGFLLVAWDRVAGNKGARTAGIDGRTARSVEAVRGVEEFLDGLRSSLQDRSFRPVPVRERMIPKAGGKLRRLRRRKQAPPPLSAPVRHLLGVQQGRCTACGGLLLHADQHPQSPQQWEQWVRVTLAAIRKQHIAATTNGGSDDLRLIHSFCRRRPEPAPLKDQ
jgi:hypothetical protein